MSDFFFFFSLKSKVIQAAVTHLTPMKVCLLAQKQTGTLNVESRPLLMLITALSPTAVTTTQGQRHNGN